MTDNHENSSSKPLISFIVTIYNLPVELVRGCLDSILSLSLRPAEREIILVDDGSDTSIMEQLMSYAADIVYIRQRNGGPSAARNTGLRMATGQYIQFVDGDDKLIAEGYGHCVDLVRYDAPDMVLFDSSDKENVSATYYMPEPVDGTHYMRHNNLHAVPWGYVFNRNILLDLRFTPGIINEDEEFTPQLMLRAERVFSTNIPAYFYRKRNESITHDRSRKFIIRRLNDMERIIFHLNEVAASLPLAERQALGRRVAQLTMDYIYNVMKFTRSCRQLEERLQRLEKEGLFPLPDKDYTKKYMLFRKLANSRMVRRMMALVLRQKV